MSYLDGRRSKFPDDGIDKILEMFDLPHSQKENALRYRELKLKEVLSQNEQAELNQLTGILQDYIITPETWNYFGDVLINMQKFFKEGVEPYIEDRKKEFQQEIDKFAYLEEWKPDIYYYKKNIVKSGGSAYIAKLDNINQPPPIAKYWGLIAEKGDKGEPSLNIHYRGEYDPAMAYVQGDAVVFGEKHKLWYYAKKNTQGNPPTNPEYWELQNNQTYVGDTEPFDKRITLWIDTNI